MTSFGKKFIIVGVATIVATLAVLHVILGYLKTPPGFDYLATGHYYLDYFVYTQAIQQGIWGRWFYGNPHEVVSQPILLVWEPYILLGKLASFFGISSFLMYWIAVFVLSFFLAISIYILIQTVMKTLSFENRLAAFLLTLSASSFIKLTQINGNYSFELYDFWYGPTNIFKRFDPVPHHLLGNLIIVVALILTLRITIENYSKQIFFYTDSLILLILICVNFTFYPYITLIALITIIAYLIFRVLFLKQGKNVMPLRYLYLILLMLIAIVFGILVKNEGANTALLQRLNEIDQAYVDYPSIALLVLSLGPVLLLSFFGLRRFKYLDIPALLLLVLFTTTSLFFSYSPIATYIKNFNLRFLSAQVSIFFGIFAVLGLKSICQLFNKQKKILFRLAIALLMIYFLVASGKYFTQRLNDTNLNTPITYVSHNITTGFRFLNTVNPHNALVLTTPSQYFGLLIPLFAEKKMFLGRLGFTPDYKTRESLAYNFYNGTMTADEALTFLKNNNIGFVVVTSNGGFAPSPFADYHFFNGIFKNYSFLKEIYRNHDIVIFGFKKIG